MPFVEAAGVKTSYQSIGRHTPTLLLLHGWGNDWQAWSTLIPVLSQKYRLIIPDLPGFGRSEAPQSGWSTEQYIVWLAEFLEKLEVTQLEAVLGHSYGAKLAAFSWLTRGDNLPQPKHHLLLISPSGVPARLSLGKKLVGKILPVVPYFLRRQILAPVRTFYYRRLLEEDDYINATPFQEKTLQKILREDIRDQKISVSLPLHLCWGENDRAVPLWMAYEYASLTNNSDVFVVPQAGHFAHQTNLSLVQSWIEAHL